jgi:hypothetical protein
MNGAFTRLHQEEGVHSRRRDHLRRDHGRPGSVLPYYTQPGVVYKVTGADPYRLDANGDGLACG